MGIDITVDSQKIVSVVRLELTPRTPLVRLLRPRNANLVSALYRRYSTKTVPLALLVFTTRHQRSIANRFYIFRYLLSNRLCHTSKDSRIEVTAHLLLSAAPVGTHFQLILGALLPEGNVAHRPSGFLFLNSPRQFPHSPSSIS